VWTNAGPAATFPPVTYGLACAFRRAVFAEYGFYDPWVVGGGAKLVCFAADGHWREGADSMRFHGAVREHFRRWVEGFHSVVRGEWGCIRGGIAHLWHGNPGNRKYRARHDEFERFQFDPSTDLALDENGLWRWNSDKPDMHQYVRDYFAGRQEDG
jgi:hypothetical protein